MTPEEAQRRANETLAAQAHLDAQAAANEGNPSVHNHGIDPTCREHRLPDGSLVGECVYTPPAEPEPVQEPAQEAPSASLAAAEAYMAARYALMDKACGEALVSGCGVLVIECPHLFMAQANTGVRFGWIVNKEVECVVLHALNGNKP